MEPSSFEQLIEYFLLAIVVTGSFGLASGVVIWAIKGYLNLRTKIPRAACAYITMKDLLEHCKDQQGGFREIMDTKLDAAIGALTARLKAGDKIFEDHRVRLREVEKHLTVKISDLTQLNKDLRKLINEKSSEERKQISGP